MKIRLFTPSQLIFLRTSEVRIIIRYKLIDTKMEAQRDYWICWSSHYIMAKITPESRLFDSFQFFLFSHIILFFIFLVFITICRWSVNLFSCLLSVSPTWLQEMSLVPAVPSHILRACHRAWYIVGAESPLKLESKDRASLCLALSF